MQQADSNRDFRQYVATRLQTAALTDTERYALGSYLHHTPESPVCDPGALSASLSQWTAAMLARRTSPATAVRYLKKISAVIAAFAPDWDRRAIRRLADVAARATAVGRIDPTPLRQLLRQGYDPHPGAHIALKALLSLIALGGADVSQAPTLTLDGDIRGASATLQRLQESQRSPRRRYMFPLGQGRRRPAAIADSLRRDIAAILGIPAAQCPPDIAAALWIEAALELRLPLDTIAAVVTTLPRSYGWLRLIAPAPLSAARRSEALEAVADWYSPVRRGWYALSLRDRTTPDGIRAALDDTMAARYRLFYPVRTRVERRGRRMVKTQEPLLPRVLFFEADHNDIRPLMSRIGHLAWCYRSTTAPDAPYAEIPRWQMAMFRRIIGAMDATDTVALTTERPLGPAMHVRVTGGLFQGYQGYIRRVKTDGDTRLITLQLSQATAISCQIQIPDHYIQVID